jgi:hypothetical protein
MEVPRRFGATILVAVVLRAGSRERAPQWLGRRQPR